MKPEINSTQFLQENKAPDDIYLPSNHHHDSPIPMKAGWGKCWIQWCNCKAFEGNDSLCTNCGHPYDQHYG